MGRNPALYCTRHGVEVSADRVCMVCDAKRGDSYVTKSATRAYLLRCMWLDYNGPAATATASEALQVRMVCAAMKNEEDDRDDNRK